MSEEQELSEVFTDFCTKIQNREGQEKLADEMCDMTEDDFWTYIDKVNRCRSMKYKELVIDYQIKKMQDDFDA